MGEVAFETAPLKYAPWAGIDKPSNALRHGIPGAMIENSLAEPAGECYRAKELATCPRIDPGSPPGDAEFMSRVGGGSASDPGKHASVLRWRPPSPPQSIDPYTAICRLGIVTPGSPMSKAS